jgi:trigger factor
LDTTVDKLENSEALIKIKLNEADYQQQVNQKIKDYSKKANIKGFRPGKVPFGLIKKLYGTSILAEEVNQMLSTEVNKALRESELQFLGEPLPNEEKMKSIDWDNQKDFEFEYSIGHAEDFDLKLDKKTKIDFHTIKIDKKLIDETIENLQKQFGEVSNPEVAAEGDTVYGNLSADNTEIQQELSIELDQLEKAAAKKFVGAKLGDTVEFDAKKAFKEDGYFKRISGLSDEDVKAAKGKFRLEIKGINHTEPAPVDQELFDKTFGKDGVKSEEEFRDKVQDTIKQNYAKEEEAFFQYKLRDKLIEKTEITLPDPFLKRWLLRTNENMDEQTLENEYENYVKELKWSLIRNKVAKENEIKVEHEDVLAEAKELILNQFGGASVAAQLGDQLDAIANNYLQGENGDNYMKVYNQVQSRKVYDVVKEKIGVKEKEVSVEDFRNLS